MKDPLNDFENTEPKSFKTRRVIIVYLLLLAALILVILRAYVLWKRIVHH
ncbi:hypothetical protein [Ginsengibacter hankyongi]|nr:hypothetical protein [Ginsengibacter hankyongi]